MQLIPVLGKFVDKAWKEGADSLKEACFDQSGEVTIDQLKMLISRGERILLKMADGDTIKGWGVVRIDQLPNLRVMYVTNLVAHNGDFERFFELLCQVAKSEGCSRVRCAAKPAQERLFRMKCGFKPIYNVLETEV